MATESLVIEQIDEGRMLIDQLARKGVGIAVAFWLKREEEKPWEFYLICDVPRQDILLETYGLITKELQSLPGPWLWPSGYRIIGKDDPIAIEAIDLQGRHAKNRSIRRRISSIGGMPVEEIYIYAPPKPPRIWPKVAVSVTYVRASEENRWSASVEREEVYRDLEFKGVMSHSRVHWQGEKPSDTRLFTVSILVEVNPDLDNEQSMAHPAFDRMIKVQACLLADRELKSEFPGSTITYFDRVGDLAGTMDQTVHALEAQAHPG